MRRSVPILAALLLSLPPLSAQNEAPETTTPEVSPPPLPVGLPVKLDISRRPLKNFLTDGTALAPYLSGDGSPTDFEGAFSLGAPGARFVPIWDPLSCRLVGVLDLESPESSAPPAPAEEATPQSGPSTPYVLLASGPSPTSTGSGGGTPSYFGIRLVQGKPEFLYTHGSTAVAEMIWLEDEGAIMKQRFSFRQATKEVVLTFPPDWKDRITSSVGEWSGNLLKIPKESAAEVTLLYRLNEAITSAESGKEAN